MESVGAGGTLQRGCNLGHRGNGGPGQCGRYVGRLLPAGIDGAAALRRAVVDVRERPAIVSWKVHNPRSLKGTLPQRCCLTVSRAVVDGHRADPELSARAGLPTPAEKPERTPPGATGLRLARRRTRGAVRQARPTRRAQCRGERSPMLTGPWRVFPETRKIL